MTDAVRYLLPLLLLVLALAAPAQASTPEIGIADDRILMPGGPTADRAVAEWRALGVDTVRIFALWSRIAPPQKPRGFRPADPNDPRYQWFYLDGAVNRVRAAGMRVTLTVTGPGPAWTSAKPSRRQGQWKPRPSAYAAFARAVATRYGAQVDRYILWNEPNISAWLSPQARCKRRKCTPVSPHLYRVARQSRLSGDRRERPGGADRDRGAVPARSAAQELEHGHAPAGVPAPARLPDGLLPADEEGRVPPLQAGDRRRIRDPSLQRAERAREAPPAATTTSAWRRSGTCRPRSTGCSAPAPCGPPRAASTSSSTSTATRPTRPTGSPASSRGGRTRTSSGRRTSPGARRGSSSSRSTCGATSRAARPAGSRASGSPAVAPSRASPTSTRRSCSTGSAAGSGARCAPGARTR